MDTDLRTNNSGDNEQEEAVKRSLLRGGEHRTLKHKRKDDGESDNTKSSVEADQHHLDQREPCEQDRLESAVHEATNWKSVATVIHDELPEIDRLLSRANIPITSRRLEAFNIIGDTRLKVSDWKRFLISAAHGKIRIIIDDWYRERYGEKLEEDEDAFISALLIHETPFILRVPKSFKIAADKPNMVWVGYPASVQKEEEPLNWIQSKDVVKGLSVDDQDSVRKEALETANLVRSIDFDIRSLEQDPDSNIAQLAGSVRTDIQSSASNLCKRNEGALRSATWDASQATEKAIKILIRRYGQTPPHHHKLLSLAQKAESLDAQTIDRTLLNRIPSGKKATNLRYGGEITLTTAFGAYDAALSIIRQTTFEAKPKSKCNIREARFLIKRPPWFNFDTHEFRQKLLQ